MHHHLDQYVPRLLAIDDSMMIHRLLKERLKDERLEVHSAMNGQQGLDAARKLQPDVILLNIDMPDPDGYETLAALKSEPVTHDLPVIFLSAACDTQAKIQGLELGALDYVSKPFDLGELKARVRVAIRISRLIKMLAQRAQIDGLTGLWNRAHFDLRLGDEISIAQRHKTSLSLILCDLDRFKNVNDSYGHPFGDTVLEEFGRILMDGRTGDVACRYGGEEFAIIVPRSDATEAAGMANRFRRSLEEQTWDTEEHTKITASFGVTDLTLTSETSIKALLDSADQAMYSAKQSGRNCVVVASSPDARQDFIKLSA